MTREGHARITTALADEKEWHHESLQNFMEWIVKNTPKNAVFSGDMTIMSHVMLCTDRPVTNHPHYETEEIRNRTSMVYSIFTCKKPKEVHDIFKELGTDYVELNLPSCGKGQVFGAECSESDRFCKRVEHSQLFEKVYDKDSYRLFKVK